MARGTVKWFNDAKGFGFIEPEGGGADIFAHFTAILMEGFRTLREGSDVIFEVLEGPKGMLAQNIQPLDLEVKLEVAPESGFSTPANGNEHTPMHSSVADEDTWEDELEATHH